MSAPDWWRTFFSGVAVECWLRCTPPEMTRAEADFIQEALRLPSEARVLDVPCGGGRHARELAARGYRVTGVDLSSDCLQAARARPTDPTPVAWERRDMRDLPWQAEFDGAYCFGNSFGYLDDDGNVAFLHAIARSLKPGARFALQYGSCAESLLPALQERRWYEIGDIHFLVRNRYDHVHGRLETEYTFIRDGDVDRRSGSQRVYAYRELCHLLGAAGFGEFDGFTYDGKEPFRLGAQGLLLVATRQ